MIDVTFTVDAEVAQSIVESIDESIADEDDVWTFKGDFGIGDAEQIRNNLNEQLAEYEEQKEIAEEYESYDPQ